MAERAFEQLMTAMSQGRSWAGMDKKETARDLLQGVFNERFHKTEYRKFQPRTNLQAKADAASFAGWITAENPTSGPYQGTCLVWFPGDGGSVAVLGVGTMGFGSDTHILASPGHRRRLRALSRIHRGRLWVKPDLLDLNSRVPASVVDAWPGISKAEEAYSRVIYATVAVREGDDGELVSDLIDLFFHEHGIRMLKAAEQRWKERQQLMFADIFPKVDEEDVASVLRERRYAVLEGPPGTGKTRLALRVASQLSAGEPTVVQFHPARTYEDFVVCLAPEPGGEGLSFGAKAGDLIRANHRALEGPHVLVVDEINRGDLGRVLGEAIYLFEPSATERVVELAHGVRPAEGEPEQRELRLSPQLMVLGTRNTADRSIARMDLAIRRRFAFLEMWPDMQVVVAQGDELATHLFGDTIDIFTEHADDEGLHLTPGHAYFLDPRPDMNLDDRPRRIARRLKYEVLPLLRDYVSERLLGPATTEVAGLADRIEVAAREGMR